MEEKPKIKDRITNFYRKCARVWHLLRKPTREEFVTVAKVSALGILAIGLVGFIISVAIKLTITK
jgi:protein transport protein SEC61 subunit gamma-like protein